MAFLLWLYYPPTIQYEDNKLHNLFGEDWERWSKVTKALIPSLKPFSATAVEKEEKGSWSFSKSLRTNGEPIIVAYLVFWLVWLYFQIV